MNIMIIGNGGREHAIAWKLSLNDNIEKIYCVPGNGGTELEKKCENINMKETDEIIKFAKINDVKLTIVGPEKYLVEGIVDEFKKEGLNIIGPDKNTSILEGSKIYAKKFAEKYGVQTAKYKPFDNIIDALEYIKNIEDFPIVIKADGLAAGKGVVIADNYIIARNVLTDFMINDIFNGAGKKIVIEEYLTGYEMSVFVLLDGENYKIFQSAMDHKKINEGEKGLNTGGMGAISPHPKLNKDLLGKIEKKIIMPTIRGIKNEKLVYNGVLFFGLIIQNNEPYLLEYNVRFGDPETQAMMPLLKTDLYEIFDSILKKKLKEIDIEWEDEVSCCVVLASKGYPMKYEKDKEIVINDNIKVFHAGTKVENDTILTNGGRVLSVVETDKNLKNARKKAYQSLEKVIFENKYYRKDIGKI
ncbi:phosphoribosylamine--glycine ligase [Marinitoga arctica]